MLDYEMYEDNAGGLRIYAVTSDDDGGCTPVWGDEYAGPDGWAPGYGPEDSAAADWRALMVQGNDPVVDCWDGMGTDDLARSYEQDADRTPLIAASWHADREPMGVYVRDLGTAGRKFARSLGLDVD